MLFFSGILHKTYLSRFGFYKGLADLFRLYADLLSSDNTVKLQRADFNVIRCECYQLINEEQHRNP